MADYTAHSGGFQIILTGFGPVGSVVLPGLRQHDDHVLAAEGTCIVLGRNYATSALD